jgi:hypothetical protein
MKKPKIHERPAQTSGKDVVSKELASPMMSARSRMLTDGDEDGDIDTDLLLLVLLIGLRGRRKGLVNFTYDEEEQDGVQRDDRETGDEEEQEDVERRRDVATTQRCKRM